MDEIDNVKVFHDTQKQTREKYPADVNDVEYYNGVDRVEASEELTPITMIHGGTVNTGYSYADTNKVAILNFADAIKFGGWVEHGAQTQEENICRCTNIYPVLGSAKSYKNYYKPNKDSLITRVDSSDLSHYGRPDEVYTDRIIYARNITVFKDDTTYENVSPRQLDVITCPAPSACMEESVATITFTKRIIQIVLSAIQNKVDCIVLGAWGCGAFGQSPELIARAFARVLNNYGGYFKHIVFAIKPTPNWGEDDMYNTFDEILSKHYKGGVMYEE